MSNDIVDGMLAQWDEERPELEAGSLGVVVRVMHLAKAFLRQADEALRPQGLELFEYDVLSTLRRQGRPYAMAASRLAKQAELSTGAMTNRVDKLEARGLVRRETDATDRRAVIVRLTAAGLEVIDDAIKARFAAADRGLSGLDADEVNALAGLLRKLSA